MIVSKVLTELIGLRLGDRKILEFIAEFGENFSIEELDGDVYFSFQGDYLEILFKDKVLNSIFLNLEKVKLNEINRLLVSNDENVIGVIEDVISLVIKEDLIYGGGEESIIGFIDPWIKFPIMEKISINISYDINTHIIKRITLLLSE